MESVVALMADLVLPWGDDQATGAIYADLRYFGGVAGQRNHGIARGPDLEWNERRMGRVHVRRRQEPSLVKVDVQSGCETGMARCG